MSPRPTPREMLLEVADREGWHVLHDLGLHVMLQRGERRFSMQFDAEGHCTWCDGDWSHLRPMDAAVQFLIQIVPPRSKPRQQGHL